MAVAKDIATLDMVEDDNATTRTLERLEGNLDETLDGTRSKRRR